MVYRATLHRRSNTRRVRTRTLSLFGILNWSSLVLCLRDRLSL